MLVLGDLPVTGWMRRVYGIMLVHDIYCFSLEGELDVDCAAAVVGRQYALSAVCSLNITSIRVM
jgi:hypothetical protein